MTPFDQKITEFLAEIPETRARRLRTCRALPDGFVSIDERALLNFASNDYLGLAGREFPGLDIDSAVCSSRLVTGNHPLFEEIEEKLSRLKGTESALVFGTGFQANATVLATLLSSKIHGTQPGGRRPNVLVFADRLVHASFHAGVQMAGARQIRFAHNDLNHLDELLARNADEGVAKIILTESVFSMDGDRIDPVGLRAIAKRHQALLYVDEAHATGVLGENGMGLMARSDREQRIGESGRQALGCLPEVIVGTFSKAFGAFGAYIACSNEVKRLLVNACPGLIYSTGLPPSMLARISATLDWIPGLDSERAELEKLSGQMRGGLKSLGVETLESSTQIIPAIIGKDQDATTLARKLEKSGYLVGAIRPPTVPVGSARLRISVCANHRMKDVKDFLAAFEKVLGEL